MMLCSGSRLKHHLNADADLAAVELNWCHGSVQFHQHSTLDVDVSVDCWELQHVSSLPKNWTVHCAAS